MKTCEYILVMFDDERSQNYCMSFFEGNEVENHAEVPGYNGETALSSL